MCMRRGRGMGAGRYRTGIFVSLVVTAGALLVLAALLTVGLGAHAANSKPSAHDVGNSFGPVPQRTLTVSHAPDAEPSGSAPAAPSKSSLLLSISTVAMGSSSRAAVTPTITPSSPPAPTLVPSATAADSRGYSNCAPAGNGGCGGAPGGIVASSSVSAS